MSDSDYTKTMAVHETTSHELSKISYSQKDSREAEVEDLRDVEVGDMQDVDGTKPLEETFSIWSALGLQYSLTSTPLAIGTYLASVIGVGGSPVFIFGYIFAVGCNLCVCVSLAEIAAVYPHTAGQIYWTAAMAPKKMARGLSYISAWITGATYFFLTAACMLLASQLVWALVVVIHSTFIIQPWHYYVGYIAATIISLAINVPLFKLYPYMLKSMVLYINAGSIFVLIALLVRAHPKQSATYVFSDFVNSTGWSSKGVVFFLGLLPGATAVNAFEGAAHLADEIPEPAKNVPRVMLGSAVLSALAGFPMCLVYMFCIVDTEALLTPVGGQPIAQLMLDSFDSTALTVIGILIYAITMLAAGICLLTSFSRILWSISLQGALPCSKLMGSIDSRWNLPVNSICAGSIGVVVIGAILLGSTTAINAILGGGIVLAYLSYFIVIACLFYRTRARILPAVRHFNIGRWGLGFNIIAILWMPLIIVWLCFPDYVPVTGTTLNYTSPVIAAVTLLATINWFAHSRKYYTVPVAMGGHNPTGEM